MKRQHLLLFITQSPHFLWRFSAFVLPLWLLLVLTLLLNGCGGQSTDPLARFRPAMRPAFQQEIAALNTLPRYEMNIELFPEQNRLTGSMRIFLTNTSSEPWQQLVFRLYPELRDYGGNLTVNSAVAGGAKFSPPQALLADYQANNTAVSLRLPDFLRAGLAAAAFFAAGFGMVKDRFGTTWMVMVQA